MSDSISNNDAFEYVVGSLRGDERDQFESRLKTDKSLQDEVGYWQEHFMALENTRDVLTPHAETWSKIENALVPGAEPQQLQVNLFERWKNWLLMGTSLACVLMFMLLIYNPMSVNHQPMSTVPNADYIAVLTNGNGEAQLTAMMLDEDKSMWLQWEGEEADRVVKTEGSKQLWAISRRDSEPRSITVFEGDQPENLELSEAQWRLITDAEYLVLTEEEAGGSAIDEPSELVLAKGFCVRYRKDKGNS